MRWVFFQRRYILLPSASTLLAKLFHLFLVFFEIDVERYAHSDADNDDEKGNSAEKKS